MSTRISTFSCDRANVLSENSTRVSSDRMTFLPFASDIADIPVELKTVSPCLTLWLLTIMPLVIRIFNLPPVDGMQDSVMGLE